MGVPPPPPAHPEPESVVASHDERACPPTSPPTTHPESESVVPCHDGGEHGAQCTDESRDGDDHQELGVAIGHVHGGEPVSSVGWRYEAVWEAGMKKCEMLGWTTLV